MERPKILITNEAGINAAGLHALVNALAKTNLYDVVLCIPDPIDIAYGHSITWEIALVAKRVDFKGANLAYVLSGTTVDCTSLGLSGKLFPFVPDLVISGISKAVSWGYCINYSGTVAGAREAFLHGVPSVSISHNWINVAHGHCISTKTTFVAKRVEINGAKSAYVLSGTIVDCTSLGLSGKLFSFVPDLVIIGISGLLTGAMASITWGQ